MRTPDVNGRLKRPTRITDKNDRQEWQTGNKQNKNDRQELQPRIAGRKKQIRTKDKNGRQENRQKRQTRMADRKTDKNDRQDWQTGKSDKNYIQE
jgi:hypothetical protein